MPSLPLRQVPVSLHMELPSLPAYGVAYDSSLDPPQRKKNTRHLESLSVTSWPQVWRNPTPLAATFGLGTLSDLLDTSVVA